VAAAPVATGRTKEELTEDQNRDQRKPSACRRLPLVLVRGGVWAVAGSNRRPSAFQVKRRIRRADLRVCTTVTSEPPTGGLPWKGAYQTRAV